MAAVSRYRNLNILDQHFFETVEFPEQKLLDEVPVTRIRVSKFDRLDQLAFQHLGAGEYWWVIAVMNDIQWMFFFDEGQILKIPINVEDVLRLF